jgi:precorrin-6A synthase
MKRILVIGIGSGGMDLLTVQAIEALRATDVFFIFDKGEEKGDLARLRKEICARYCTDKSYRVVEMASPARDTDGSYKSGVAAWHAERAALAGDAIRNSLADEESGAFLVWGDPALYDSTLRIIEAVIASGDVGIDYEVIPGISSVQVLAARHKIPLNAIGEPLLVTTGRKITEAFPSDWTSVVVFLDNGDGLRSLAGRKAHIYWGAYLGTDDEVLISGPIDDVLDRILEVRADRRRAKGWIMDIYLIRACGVGDVFKLPG